MLHRVRHEMNASTTEQTDSGTTLEQDWVVTALLAVLAVICPLVALLAARQRRNSMRRRTWSVFISHSKRDAGDVAATFKRDFDRQLRKNKCGSSCLSTVGPSFLDVSTSFYDH